MSFIFLNRSLGHYYENAQLLSTNNNGKLNGTNVARNALTKKYRIWHEKKVVKETT